jgi:hypothetical protein
MLTAQQLSTPQGVAVAKLAPDWSIRSAARSAKSPTHYDRVMADEKRAGFIAGGPRRSRNEGEGFWTFLRDWIASLFRVDRRM